MIHAKATQHSHSHSLMEVLHRMTMQSRSNQIKTEKRRPITLSMQDALPNGDPSEVTLWGEA
jgi:hypothetical protein